VAQNRVVRANSVGTVTTASIVTWAKLVHMVAVDLGECFVGVGSGEDPHGAVAVCGTDEFLDAPAGLVFEPVDHGGKHHGEVGFDGVAGA
jgi:hypothetical protein